MTNTAYAFARALRLEVCALPGLARLSERLNRRTDHGMRLTCARTIVRSPGSGVT